MKTVATPAVLTSLQERLSRLAPTAEPQWGRMNVQQMLTHLASAMERVLSGEQMPMMDGPPNRFIKFIALRTPLAWPKGLPSVKDPAAVAVDPAEFEACRDRVHKGLQSLAAWEVTTRTTPHPAFGNLTTREWQCWAYKHANHHLRQFGV